ncbi:hypothetical protein B0H66DRAFT_504330 [Apodospora peruviana]|uniref:NAD-dependent epimerase/dehydratase domain-containing protein n=1 Tax=Apodospora peruviana TaxID=516989 RepID=A0AAE0M0A6_9PEZI|nr:hypothetical protein B0H66DRAFT_504330 [Apodospora peruviana]
MAGGSILITGANGSIAIPLVKYLLTHSPDYTLVLTVRDASSKDVNTNQLREVIAQHPGGAKATVHSLNLFRLAAVHEFAQTITTQISQGVLPPLASIVCNAYYWNLVRPVEFTEEGFEKTFQATHLAHAALVLRLLGSFGPDGGGRVVFFSTDAIFPGKNSLEKITPAIPDDLELLVKPDQDKPVDNLAHGFHRYANAKLAAVMWACALNRHLEKDPKLNKIAAVAVNPGNISDSRALRTNTPGMLVFLSKFVLGPLRPLASFLDPTMRTSAAAAEDVARLATNDAHPGERGYFTLLKRDESPPDTKDEKKQEELWVRTARWAGITGEETALRGGF